ncbi:hypothetical protein NM688_g6052 [Phlebia brevispora]|uniref:Uncharacterized protein n=1 Tax=Phlebia brevispora TaxID=194682 RepID=A0ACC1SKK5_9APHY|nr:hypothetical protein NM688_g6052 [Phlebia brevispora]
MNARLTIILCLSLHAMLVLIYAAILITYKVGVYNRPLASSQETVSAVIAIVSQSFTIAYCAVLVLLTQRISLHDFISHPQTLSAMHDKSSAWLGLGSSVQTLIRQSKLVTDFVGVSMITLYLLLIFVVHTTLPTIFRVATQSSTLSTSFPTILARQSNVWQLLYVLCFIHFSLLINTVLCTTGSGGANDTSSGIYSILQVYDSVNLTSVGVWNNMVYDIIPDVPNAADTKVQVNATTFSVDCTSLPDIVQTSYSMQGWYSQDQYVFEFAGGKYSVELVPMGTDQFQILVVEAVGDVFNSPSMLVVASTYPLVDSMGVNATAINMNPMWAVVDPYDPVSTAEESETIPLYIVACNFDPHNSTVGVNPQSRTIEQSAAASTPEPAHWHEWIDPGNISDPLLLETLGNFIANAPEPEMPTNVSAILLFNATGQWAAYSDALTMVEWFLPVDILASRNASADTEVGAVTIGELDWSLGRAYAAVLWYYNSVPSLQLTFETSAGDHRDQGQVSIPSTVLEERLTINTISLYIGLGASCLLFVVTVILITRAGNYAADIIYHDVSGLLPVLWLLGNEPRLAGIEEPDIDDLRAAGMYEVPGTGNLHLRRRVDAEKGTVEKGAVGEGTVEGSSEPDDEGEPDRSSSKGPRSTYQLLACKEGELEAAESLT